MFLLAVTGLLLVTPAAATLTVYQGDTVHLDDLSLTWGQDYTFSVSTIEEYHHAVQIGQQNISIAANPSAHLNATLWQYDLTGPPANNSELVKLGTTAPPGTNVTVTVTGIPAITYGLYEVTSDGTVLHNQTVGATVEWSMTDWSTRNVSLTYRNVSTAGSGDTTAPDISLSLNTTSTTAGTPVQVSCSASDARIIYLSSQTAFGDEIGASQYGDWSLYTREKRNAEDILMDHCDATGKPGYAFRLRFVHGANQPRTEELRDAVSDHSHVHLAADPEKPSNVIHTVTLLDAILECGHGRVSPGTYSIVNQPQWTWRDVCEYYKPEDVTLHFYPPSDDDSYLRTALSRLWRLIESRQRTLRTLTVYLPDAINEFLFYKYLQQQRGGELADLQDRITVERPAFKFDPIPGPFINDLPETRQQLVTLKSICDTFKEPER